MFGLHVYLYATCTPGVPEDQKLGSDPVALELWKLGAAMWILEIKPGSSVHVSSPAPSHAFLTDPSSILPD